VPNYFCCFVDPGPSREERSLDEACPRCGRPYGFPLVHAPEEIADYRIRSALGRGFYAATYLAEHGALGRRYVLKVVPTAIYAHFGKDFVAECVLHRDVAEHCEHLVDIIDMLGPMPVEFGDTTIDCHVAVLEYVEGMKLLDFATDPQQPATAIAQVSVDLLELLRELEAKERYHNDLHSENIIVQRLGSGSRRANAVDEDVRAVAIDLGSLADASKSADRLGDLQSVARHLFSFGRRLLEDPDRASETDYRLAAQLEEIGRMLSPDALKQRTPDFDHFIDLVRDAVRFVASPWMAPGPLKRFNEAYNAQTLHPWFVPQLLVDPEGEWLPAVSTPEPQIITGMRGCGKTMLLRALQFHARAHAAQQNGSTGDDVIQRLREDRYVGLYVSCNRLLDGLGDPSGELHEPYARLFLAYAREALRAVRHLRELDRNQVVLDFHAQLAAVVARYLEGAEGLAESPSEMAVERSLQRMSASLERGESRFTLSANHTIVFGQLAEAVRSCSPIWQNAVVLYLLDDVSTRHLERDSVSALLATLLFPSESCAFKLTTELQTVEDILRSPGGIERARPGRDYEMFDLGAAVNERLRPLSRGMEFISAILDARRKHFPPHPEIPPDKVLGKAALHRIANEIVSSDRTARERKAIYHGVNALTALCVGDIGDVIYLYEMILRASAGRDRNPVDPRVQHRCFREYCARRLYHLNRRDKRMRDFALSFAEASHELLLQSHREMKEGKESRLRIYSKLYVSITTGDTSRQFEQIRDLIDAGVFVFDGPSDAPRSKTRHSNPIQQFVLVYRKLFGLSHYIGLSNRDRFELGGEQLQEWLDHPDRGREILVRHLGGEDPVPLEDDTDGEPDAPPAAEPEAAVDAENAEAVEIAPRLFKDLGDEVASDDQDRPELDDSFAVEHVARAVPLEFSQLPSEDIVGIVLGLGFEERTLASAKVLLERLCPRHALLVRYPEPGYGPEIEALVRERVHDVTVVDYDDFLNNGGVSISGPMMIDVTGLAKPALFSTVRNALRRDGRVWVTHTLAEVHYPLSEEIDRVFAAEKDHDPYAQLQAQDRVWAGEDGPYTFEKLLATDADDSRRRLLCASASPKHQRLLSLVDEREFDRIELIAPDADTPRSRLARLAADVAIRGAESAEVVEIGSNDVAGALGHLARLYHRWFVRGGFDFELALTGSKMHAVAFAAASASLKISQCWYVRPRNFDPQRFTHGVGEHRYFGLELPHGPVEADTTSSTAECPARVSTHSPT
jgi:hypothetical protein